MMVVAAAAASLILNMAWLWLLARRAGRLTVLMAGVVAVAHGLLLVNAVGDVVHVPMWVDGAGLAWHVGVLPFTLGLSMVGWVVTRRRGRAAHAT